MRIYRFQPVRGYLFTKKLVERISKALSEGLEEVAASLDLGLSRNTVKLDGNWIWVGSIRLSLEELARLVVKDDLAYYVDPMSGSIVPLSYSRGGNYYKLKLVDYLTAPTLEINGIHMHNIRGTTPWDDAGRKVSYIRPRRGSRVLDIGTGLGYISINSMLRGASVVTIEKDPNVLEIARYNPWSWRLASPRIRIVLGDAFEVIDEFSPGQFSSIINDPPRFSMAGELYSLAFYKKMYRVLRRKGKVFHYTGSPGLHRGVKFQAGVARRLREAGFTIIKILKDYGIVARKP